MQHLCDAAVKALEHAFEEPPEQIYDNMVAAVCCLVHLRDDLIGRKRAGVGMPGVQDQLERTNSILSMVVAAEYPLVGVRQERIRKASDALRKLLEEAGRSPD